MIGLNYWATGITVVYHSPQWSVLVKFYDDGFCNKASSEGELRMRYVVDDLSLAIDRLKADADRFGIKWKATVFGCPTVYLEGDGENLGECRNEIVRIVNGEARRIGWKPAYLKAESQG